MRSNGQILLEAFNERPVRREQVDAKIRRRGRIGAVVDNVEDDVGATVTDGRRPGVYRNPGFLGSSML